MSLPTVVQTALNNLQSDPETAQLFVIVNSLGPAAVVGSAVRQWYYSETPTQINIVINCPASELSVFASYTGSQYLNLDYVTGYQFTVNGVQYFITNLNAVWPIIQNNSFVEIVEDGYWEPVLSMDVLPYTEFFNLNAVSYRLDTGLIYDGGFAACIASKQLDIVFEPNLHPLSRAADAMMLAMKYNLGFSFRLLHFIQRQIKLGLDVIYFSRYQTATYGGVIYSYDDVIKLVGN